MKTPSKLILLGSLTCALALTAGCGGGSGDGSSATKGPDKGAIMRGNMAFKNTCATCHGKDAKGMENNGTDLTASTYFASQTDEQLFQYVLEGRMEPEFGTTPMPPRGGFTEEQLTDKQIKDSIQYIRSINTPTP